MRDGGEGGSGDGEGGGVEGGGGEGEGGGGQGEVVREAPVMLDGMLSQCLREGGDGVRKSICVTRIIRKIRAPRARTHKNHSTQPLKRSSEVSCAEWQGSRAHQQL